MTLRALGIAGSLRRDSFNRRLLSALADRAPSEIELELFQELEGVPLFSEDLEGAGAPPAVQRMWSLARQADALIFATPEYNQSLPGVMKNAVDWLSRDPSGSSLDGKLCAVTGATVGRWGTRLAQQQLRTVLTNCGASVLTTGALFVAQAQTVAMSERELDDFWAGIVSDCGLRMAA